jgi:hypothetical protein
MSTGSAPSLSHHHSLHNSASPVTTPVSTAVWPALAVPLQIATWRIEEMPGCAVRLRVEGKHLRELPGAVEATKCAVYLDLG